MDNATPGSLRLTRVHALGASLDFSLTLPGVLNAKPARSDKFQATSARVATRATWAQNLSTARSAKIVHSDIIRMTEVRQRAKPAT